AFAALFGVLLLSTINAVRAGAQAHAIDGLPSRRADSTAAALLAEDFDALLASARLPQAGRVLRALLARPWPTTLAFAASAFIAVSAVGIAGPVCSCVAGAYVRGSIGSSMLDAVIVRVCLPICL